VNRITAYDLQWNPYAYDPVTSLKLACRELAHDDPDLYKAYYDFCTYWWHNRYPGCACDIPTYRELGCDCSVVCDDGSCYWAGIQRAEDGGHPVIRVNHGTSEEPGMVTLTSYINERLDGLRAEHLPHGSTFRLVGPGCGWSGDRVDPVARH
jgi:hypothetical protein